MLVTAVQRSDSVTHTHTYIRTFFLHILFHHDLSQHSDYSGIPGWRSGIECIRQAGDPGFDAWRIPWAEEAVGLQSRGPQRVGHD